MSLLGVSLGLGRGLTCLLSLLSWFAGRCYWSKDFSPRASSRFSGFLRSMEKALLENVLEAFV